MLGGGLDSDGHNNSSAPYCQVVIAPKLEKLEKKKVIQETPQTVK